MLFKHNNSENFYTMRGKSQPCKQFRQVIPSAWTVFAIGLCILTLGGSAKMHADETISLPSPEKSSDTSVEETLARRHSTRTYAAQPLTRKQIAQLCWAAAGKTVDAVSGATRTYPSAGGIYPGELYVVAGRVKELPPGIYRYDWRNHRLILQEKGDFREKISKAALGQSSIKNAPVNFIMTADIDEMTKTYGERGRKLYIPIEAGGTAQNIHLQCESLQLGTVMIGAFQNGQLSAILNIDDEQPLWIMPVGVPSR